jgi:hypothetical protein
MLKVDGCRPPFTDDELEALVKPPAHTVTLLSGMGGVHHQEKTPTILFTGPAIAKVAK